MLTLILSKNNEFSNILFNYLLDNSLLTNVNELYYYNNIPIKFFDNFLDIKDSELENNEYIVLSSHKSTTQTEDSISIHFPGNFNTAELFGENYKLSLANINYFNKLYHILKNNINKDLKFWIEVTHHGPSVNKEIMFYEIGPNSKAYNNKDYIKYYLDCLNKCLNITPKYNNYILIGAPHYIDLEFIERIERKTNLKDICFSHIIPKYALIEMLNLDDSKLELILTETINKSQVNKIILNSDYIKSKSRLKAILNNINLKNNIELIIM